MSDLDVNYVFFIGGLLLAVSVLASKVSSLMGTPLLLLFLAIGMMSGEDGIIIQIDYSDYTSAYLISNLMLALILLDGGLRTNFGTFRAVATESLVLATVGVAVTSAVIGAVVHFACGLSVLQSLLIGSIVGSTDAGAVFSLLGGVNLKDKVSSTLQIESATNDPMAILLTTTMLALVTGQAKDPASIAMFFVTQFGLGIVLGISFGVFGRFLVATLNLSQGLYSLFIYGVGMVGFAVTSALYGSGFLEIFIFGMIVGNQRVRAIGYILPFGEGLTYFAQITLFLLLGLLVTPHEMLDYAYPGVVTAAAMVLLARPLAVFLCIRPFFARYSTRDLLFISWVGLRGSVPIVLAIYPVMAGLEDSQLYFNVAFIVVIISLLVQGVGVMPMARLFRCVAPAVSTPINKSQVGISLSDDYELYNYRVMKDSMQGAALRNFRFPSRTQIAAVFRDGHMLKATGDSRLEKEDIVSIIGHDADEPLLNSIFSQDRPQKRPLPYKGDAIYKGATLMRDLRRDLGLELTSFETGMSLSEFMSYHIGGFPQLGDSVDLMTVKFTVVELEGDLVSKAGLTMLGVVQPGSDIKISDGA
ncbi:MAG: potassium/proton antiporter [Succinivibrionaceae bacterium]|nr:potassium/proton antiporter [Succinivibrionaceae bacterium]